MKENRVLFQIKKLETMIARNFLNNGEIEDMEIQDEKNPIPTPTQMQIIEYILEHQDKEVYQKDLEEVLNLRRATVSGVLQTMEKNKLIARVTDSNDTRTKKIILNEKTREIFFQHEKRMENIEKIITKDIPEEDLKTFLGVIEKIKNNIIQ